MTGARLVSIVLVLTACGGTTSAPGNEAPDGAAGSGGADDAGGSGGVADAHTESGGDAQGGVGGQATNVCDETFRGLTAWIESHETCNGGAPCERLSSPFDHPAFCNQVVAPAEADRAELSALVGTWNEHSCGIPGFMCGGLPGMATCDNGRCRLDSDYECERCADEPLDPQCTISGRNVRNPCEAMHCSTIPGGPPEDIDHAGWCADSDECIQAGGTCEETTVDGVESPCPDTARWDDTNLFRGCAGGSARNVCCVPWNQDCSYVAANYTLFEDPFTCQELNESWTCIRPVGQDSCQVSATIGGPQADPSDPSVELTVGTNNEIVARATSGDGLHSFECAGTLSFSSVSWGLWQCRACTEGSGCTSCAIRQLMGSYCP